MHADVQIVCVVRDVDLADVERFFATGAEVLRVDAIVLDRNHALRGEVALVAGERDRGGLDLAGPRGRDEQGQSGRNTLHGRAPPRLK